MIIASSPVPSWQIDAETLETVRDFILGGSNITIDGDCSHEAKRCLFLGRKAMTKLDSILKSRHYFTNKFSSSQIYGFSSSHVQMWELGHKESWVPRNRCFWTVVLEMTLENPLDCKKIQPVHPKRNQSWIGRTDAEVEGLVLWPPDAKNWLIGKDPDAEKGWRQEEKGTTEDQMFRCCTDAKGMSWAGSRSWTGKPGHAAIHGVAKCQTWMRVWTDWMRKRNFLFSLKALSLFQGEL